MTLDELIDIFKNPNKIEEYVKEKIKDDFTASYIYPILNLLNDRFADVYVKNLTTLKNIGIENIYNDRIMPLVSAEIVQKQNEVNGYDPEELFKNISVLKDCTSINQANILYLSLVHLRHLLYMEAHF